MTTAYGSDAQRALLRRGLSLYRLTSNHPGLTYYGRTVGVASHGPRAFQTLCDLTRLQGNAAISDVPSADVPGLVAMAEDMGFAPTVYARWDGEDTALHAARAILQANALPGDLRLAWLSDTTPSAECDAFADAALACGVLPPLLSVLDGTLKPGVACYAIEPGGKVVSCAACASFLLPEGAEPGGAAWWGMLATRPERRGARLSLILGAHALLEMAKRYRTQRFFTGVAPGNAPSEAVCSRMGFRFNDRMILGLADPGLLPEGRMTK